MESLTWYITASVGPARFDAVRGRSREGSGPAPHQPPPPPPPLLGIHKLHKEGKECYACVREYAKFYLTVTRNPGLCESCFRPCALCVSYNDLILLLIPTNFLSLIITPGTPSPELCFSSHFFISIPLNVGGPWGYYQKVSEVRRGVQMTNLLWENSTSMQSHISESPLKIAFSNSLFSLSNCKFAL